MADETKPAIGGGTGGTAGTATPDSTPDSETRVKQRDSAARSSLAAGDDSVETAIGEGGGDRIAGTGSSVANSGRLSSEGTGPIPNPADPGDPGGMGGARAGSRTPHDRPPGGVSPMSGSDEENRG